MGLLDHGDFQSELSAALGTPQSAGAPFAVFTIRLRRVRRIRLALGDAVADSLLLEAAFRLSTLIAGTSMAHLEGELFCFYRTQSGEDEARQFARELLAAFHTPLHTHGMDVVIGINVGVSIAQAGMNGAQALMRQSRCALDRAAAGGEYSMEIYTPRLQASAARRLTLEIALRQAIESNIGLSVHYQPKVGLTSRKLYGVEALCRWNCPPLGAVPADEFIPVAEESDLIEMLGWRVLDQVCQQLLGWGASGFVLPCVSINLSARQLSNSDLPSKILQCTSRHGLVPSLFEFEVTESAIVEDINVAATTLARFRSLGFRIALDDFGAAHSNLHYLRKLPLDSLKIDKQFVDDLSAEGKGEALCRAMFLMADMLKLPVIVEGIETEAQCATLSRLGFEWGQGYYFSAPLPSEALAQRWLTRR
ncbi:hypothetical protein AB870_24590 (plasmid) [Pandoraea faecigallinarum]|uniref:EAL domain-containing protein n=1 Tax=Pandoraea faecigallinarum TaxID=656179 RepID=A0A0H3WZ04_9BURK|nr:GGDEF domain-containing phosphodiesterase [Pandoraea faecigallinarum]AKM33364.1 hypothetical protein AB870_24590 [Pandoraea faecigallinarum]